MGGLLSIDYGVVKDVAEAMGITGHAYVEVLEKIKLIEQEVLEEHVRASDPGKGRRERR